MRPRASAALVNAQHKLAFRKRRVKDQGEDPDRDGLAAGSGACRRPCSAALGPAPLRSVLTIRDKPLALAKKVIE